MPDKRLEIYYGYCHRLWPIAFGHPVQRCGDCNKVPEYAGHNLEEAETWVLVNKIYGDSKT